MRRGFLVVALVLAVSVPSAFAGSKKKARGGDAEVLDALALIGPLVATLAGPQAAAPDAPRLLSEALRSGNADARTMAAIVNWVLSEKEEKVAAGMADVLREAPLAASGPEAERWNATAQAVIATFQSVLKDAGAHRRPDGDALVQGLVAAAGPAVIAALSEVQPSTREDITQAVGRAAAPAARDLLPSLSQALRNPDASVRRGAVTVLGAMGASARAAVPDLRELTNDPDEAVRGAAAAALARILGE